MQTISIKSLAAVHEVASLIAGVPEASPKLVLADGPIASCPLRAGLDFTSLVFANPDGTRIGSEATIERPSRGIFDDVRPAGVSWSSSSTSGTLADAAGTATVLAFATAVAAQLNDWQERGLLPYLATETEATR